MKEVFFWQGGFSTDEKELRLERWHPTGPLCLINNVLILVFKHVFMDSRRKFTGLEQLLLVTKTVVDWR